MRKQCAICKERKDITLFAKNKRNRDGRQNDCKSCRNEANKIYYYKSQGVSDADLPAKLDRINTLKNAKTKTCKRCHKEQPKENFVPRKESIDGYRYLCKTCHLLEKQARERNMRRTNVRYRLSKNMAVGVWRSLKGAKDSKHWESLVGYAFADLRSHLEQRFAPGMTWENYGEWHVDHIRPITSFDITSYDSDAFKECWSLDNLQPLWETENKRKYNKFTQNLST